MEILILLINIMLMVFCGKLGQAKGYHFVLCLVAGFFFSFIALIVILLLPDLTEQQAEEDLREQRHKEEVDALKDRIAALERMQPVSQADPQPDLPRYRRPHRVHRCTFPPAPKKSSPVPGAANASGETGICAIPVRLRLCMMKKTPHKSNPDRSEARHQPGFIFFPVSGNLGKIHDSEVSGKWKQNVWAVRP